jgi:adenosylcobinamide kinase/adenosylcobinamide-phosphate guanylyltransferase
MRSGKSAFAEQLAMQSGRPVLFVATAQALDDEMGARIAAHQAARPAGWRTVEAPLDVGTAVAGAAGDEQVAILDCITLLVMNCLVELAGARDLDVVSTAALQKRVDQELAGVLEVVRERRLALIVVSNEVGMGVIPVVPSARHYGDVLGRANQRLAGVAAAVYLMVAGIPVDVRRLGPPPR